MYAVFGYDSFRLGQEVVINAILDGRDILAVMPTGAGKSLCYQVPAMLFSGITLVISNAYLLMQDQVNVLNEAGVNAAFINSSLSEKELNDTFKMHTKVIIRLYMWHLRETMSEGFISFAKSVENFNGNCR